MNENLRRQQLHDDTHATLEIASKMVSALYDNLAAELEEKDRELHRLRQRIAELTSQIPNHGPWRDLHQPSSPESCLETHDLAELTGVIKPGAIGK